jgi:hypothetical protein
MRVPPAVDGIEGSHIPPMSVRIAATRSSR